MVCLHSYGTVTKKIGIQQQQQYHEDNEEVNRGENLLPSEIPCFNLGCSQKVSLTT